MCGDPYQDANTTFYSKYYGIQGALACGSARSRPSASSSRGSETHTHTTTHTTKKTKKTATFTTGSVVSLTPTITANHGGRMAYSVCPLPRDQATPACFDTPSNFLTR